MMEVEKAVKQGLLASPKFIPAWYRYDKKGSLLNDECAEKSPYYYFHRSEKALLNDVIEEIMAELDFPLTLIDLGSGNAEKTMIMINGMLEQQKILDYIPVDISHEFLQQVCKDLTTQYNQRLRICPCPGDYKEGIKQILDIEKNVLLLFMGSLQSCPLVEQAELLKEVNSNLKENDVFLITADITQDRGQILEAYLDPGGFAGRFHLNAIERLNREMKGNIDLAKFTIEREFHHCADKGKSSSVEIYLKAKEDQLCRIDALDLSISFEKGERLNLYAGEGVSHKYSIEQLKSLTARANLDIQKLWTNDHVAMLMLRKQRTQISS